MDTTPEYIKKCEKAEEIQAKYRLKDGDTYAQFHAGKYESRLYHEATGGLRWVSLKAIWLPRQDQLQEMVSQTKEGVVIRWHQLQDRVNRFNQEFYEDNFLPCDLFTSFEQVWLAFVMAVKFAKRWDSKKGKWVKWR